MQPFSAICLSMVSLAVIFVAMGAAQNPSTGGKASSLATIEGVVTRDPNGEALKKVLIELIAEDQNAGGNYTATTAADGRLHIENTLPGRYHLFAERTGLLDVEKHHGRSDGRFLTFKG